VAPEVEKIMTELASNHTPAEHAKPAVPTQAQQSTPSAAAPAGAKKDAASDPKTDAKTDPKTSSDTNTHAAAKPEDKTQAKGDAKEDPKGDAKGEAKAEPKGEAKGDAALGSQALNVVSQVATQAKQAVSTRVAEQTDRGAEDLGDVAKALRKTSRQLDGNIASPLVEKAAEQLERASEFLHTANAGQMAQAAQSFARREPLLFLGGAFAAGIVVARFLKSTSHREDDASSDAPPPNEDAPAEDRTATSQWAADGGGQPQQNAQNHKRHGRKHRRH
jgi:hypothetical protein